MDELTGQIDESLLIVSDLGRVAYGDAYALQKRLQEEVISWRDEGEEGRRAAGYLLLLEHEPAVITVSRRKGSRQHLMASAAELEDAGVEVAETDRGGDITYHGPGQLVAYPIVDLNRLGLRVHSYMRLLEQIVIETVGRFGIEGRRDAEATGVWVGGREGGGSAGGGAKICAMGVRISRWVSMHGLALNVTTNLNHFELIVPCGLAGRRVTSMEALLGASCPGMDEVKRVMAEEFGKAMGALAGETARGR